MQRHLQSACRVFVVAAAALVFPVTASAHVKWFASYDETVRPKPFSEVATLTFLALFAAFLAMIFLGFLADGWVAKRWPRVLSTESSLDVLVNKWVRLGAGAFLLCTWTIGLNILTPELHTQTAWIFTVQFVSALCVAWRRTCVVSALGICALYLYGITQYGVFHMLDYVYFLGIAVFLAGVSIHRIARIRIQVMTGCLAFSIMWTAIEKFVYPQWTAQILQTHSHMTMGIPFRPFIVLAAFVEFTLAFYLATGRGLLRLGSLALLLVFVAAMPEFGRLDVVGHLPLIAVLGVLVMKGNSSLQNFWRRPGSGMVLHTVAMCLLYTLSLSLFLLAYYCVQWMEYAHVSA